MALRINAEQTESGLDGEVISGTNKASIFWRRVLLVSSAMLWPSLLFILPMLLIGPALIVAGYKLSKYPERKKFAIQSVGLAIAAPGISISVSVALLYALALVGLDRGEPAQWAMLGTGVVTFTCFVALVVKRLTPTR